MARKTSDEAALDNAVWHALNGSLSRFRTPDSTEDLVHFDRQINIFSAVERADETMWKRISEAIEPGASICLFRDAIPRVPAGWQEHHRDQGWQMLAGDLPAPSGREVVELGPDDAQEMLELADLTVPAPYFLRTRELGRYVGVRRDGRLLAMAGERLRVPGFVEISAVCTHPDARKEGLAGELTLEVARSIRAGGDEALLHVIQSNENALRLYQKLGFVVRRKVEVVFAQWHGPDWQPDEGSVVAD